MAIYILWLRQIKKFFRSKSRIAGSISQPLLFLLAFGFGFGPMYQKAEGGNYIQFLAPGIIAMSVLFMSFFSGVEIIWDKQFGFLKETLVAPVSRLKIMIGRTLGGATVATMQGLIVMIISMIVGFHPVDWKYVPVAIAFMFLIALFFAGLGTAIASKLEDMQGFQLIMNFLIMPIFFLSGAFFPSDGLPTAFKIITKIDPLSYGVNGLRSSLINIGHIDIFYNFTILSIIAIIVLIIGSYLFTKIEI